MPQQPQKPRHVPLAQQMENTRNLIILPSLTVLVFLRRDIGYRLLEPRMLGSITGFLFVFSMVVYALTDSLKSLALFAFALAAFARGMQQRFKRWREIEAGVKQHSFYAGTSPFRFPWLPQFLLRYRRVERFIDPIVVFVFGTVLMFFFHGLGFWLVSAGAGLRVFEDEVHQREVNRSLDLLDGLVMAENQTQVVEKFEEAPKQQQATQLNVSVSTGMADDIQERINRRKSKPPEPPKRA